MKSIMGKNGSMYSAWDLGPAEEKHLRIALVDGDQTTQRAAREMIASRAGSWTLDLYHTPQDLRRATHQAVPHDIVLLDIGPPSFSSTEYHDQIRAFLPAQRLLILAPCCDPNWVLQAAVAGASGYLIKPASPLEFARAVEDAAQGWPAYCREAQKALIGVLRFADQGNSSAKLLSRREREMVLYAAQGLSDKEIAARLDISSNTVHVHMIRLFRKLGVRKRHEAVGKVFGQIPCG